MKRKEPLFDRVRELLNYHKNGYFTWNMQLSNRIKKGSIAGTFCKSNGYFMIQIDGVKYLLHRIIFLWHHGYMPENLIDHIDRNQLNNRIENLREVNQQCNIRNGKLRSSNSTGVCGVYFNEQTKKWSARIRNGKSQIFLGVFKNINDAVFARYEKEVELKWNGCNSTSSAYAYLKERKLI